MLVEFRVKNFGCLRDEQVLSFVPVKDTTLQDTNIYNTGALSESQLLRTAVIYGANAGGKSTLLLALQTMLFLSSFQSSFDINKLLKVSITPFLLDKKTRNEPTEFEISFLHDNKKYQYGFTCVTDKIYDEYLFYYENIRRRTLFIREYDKYNKKYNYKFGKELRGAKKIWCDATNEKTTFLCFAGQLNNKQLLSIWSKLTSIAVVLTKKNKPDIDSVNKEIYEKIQIQKKICSFLSAADISIKDIEIRKNQIDNGDIDQDKESYSLLFKHANNDEEIKLPAEKESDGTIQLYTYLPNILNALEKGNLLVIDELDSSLHPLIVQRIVYIFQSPQINTHGAQLLFTTHDISLLQNDPQLLRRDQIWFVEKNSSQSSNLYSLTEFKKSKISDYSKIYMNGLVGGIPVLQEWN